MSSSRIFENTHGGMQKFTYSLCDWLSKRNFDVTLVAPKFASVETRRITDGAVKREDIDGKGYANKPTALCPPYTVFFVSRFFLILVCVLRLLIVNHSTPIKLIHVQDTGYFAIAGIILARILRIPMILTVHAIRHREIEARIHGGIKKILTKLEYAIDIFSVKRASYVFAVNPFISDYFEQKAHRRPDVVHPPIDVKSLQFSELKRKDARKELGIDENVLVIGFIGTFSLEKDLSTLINSFRQVVQIPETKNAKLLLVGGGPLDAELRKKVINDGIQDKVIFYGITDDVQKMFSCIDIFVLPSIVEGLSLALLEAMASSRAIICSDIPANRIIVKENVEAILIRPSDEEGFKSAISLLSKQPDLRQKLGINAKLKAEQFDRELIFPRLLDYYKEAVIERQN